MLIPRWGLWVVVLEPYLALIAIVVSYHIILGLLKRR